MNALALVLLKPAELLYRALNRARRALYRAGVLRQQRLPKPVISIGNIAVGGSGKTPATIAIGRFLLDRGLRVCVLTRGYGRSGEGGAVTSLDAARFGDEPVLIKKYLGTADVIVGRKRYENGRSIKCDVYLLDDGFQHLQLARDIDVVIVNPASSLLREGPSALRHADFVVPRNLRAVVPDGVKGRRVFAFAGLADNEQFFATLRRNDVDLAGTHSFPDHYSYTAGDIDAIKAAAKAAGATAIVTSEKDAVKIDDDAIIAVRAEFLLAPNVFDEILARIQQPSRK